MNEETSNDDNAVFEERSAQAMPDAEGNPTYQWNLTDSRRGDPVVLYYQPEYVLPIIFVPGIMGSNLKGNGAGHGAYKAGTKPVWRLDTDLGEPFGLLFGKMGKGPGQRQATLHPARTEVDDDGDVPTRAIGSISGKAEFKARGWGEVGEGSYHGYLTYLEETLNGKPDASGTRKSNAAELIKRLLDAREKKGAENTSWLPLRELQKPTDEELAALAQWRMPVYACGYNWLDDNEVAAKRLLQRIKEVIARNNKGQFSCKQVLLITHSMGGLVSRACAKLEGAEKLIAGIINGVMPANGAAVAYRRCKIGMWDESKTAALVIGKTGQHVTAVFAQAPGALELLPTQNYEKGWLEVQGPDGKTIEKALHRSDPYQEIYQRRDRWWALIKEEWLAPEDGLHIRWEHYLNFLRTATKFHSALTPTDYHPNTHVFYGDDTEGATRSFEKVTWRMTKGVRAPSGSEEAPTPLEVYGMTPQQVRMDGANPEHVGGELVVVNDADGRRLTSYETSHWELTAATQDGAGDGTVPASSGRAPIHCEKVLQVFKVKGVEHEPAYRHETVQQLTLYSLCKLVTKAEKPSAVKPGGKRE